MMTCEHCRGRGYLLTRKAEIAHAELCQCQIPCPKCLGTRFIMKQDGPYEIASPCDCHELNGRLRLFNDANVPAAYGAKSLVPAFQGDPDGFIDRGNSSLKRAKMAVSRRALGLETDDNHGLILMGGYGVGKTHLVTSLVSTLTLKRNIACRFVDYYSLLAEIRGTFEAGNHSDVSEKSLIDALVEIPVLVIDDLGKGRGSQWELTILDQIVTRRYNANRIIIATTNYLLEKFMPEGHQASAYKKQGSESLEERIGERLVSRLYASCDIFLLEGEDYRKKGGGGSRRVQR